MSKKKTQPIECYACGTTERELISLGKNHLCGPCLRLDDESYGKVDVELDEFTWAALAKRAMEANVTINAEVSHAMLLMTRNPKQLKQFLKEAKQLEEQASLLNESNFDGCGGNCSCNSTKGKKDACCKISPKKRKK